MQAKFKIACDNSVSHVIARSTQSILAKKSHVVAFLIFAFTLLSFRYRQTFHMRMCCKRLVRDVCRCLGRLPFSPPSSHCVFAVRVYDGFVRFEIYSVENSPIINAAKRGKRTNLH